jgi:LL-diaminopimelate aminotransferase
MSFFEDKIAERLGGKQFGKSTAIYKFEIIKRAKARAKQNNPGVELIDMGVGEPDWAADPSVVAKLSEEAGRPENRWYADNGIPEFQEAAARYMEKVFKVKGLNPGENILHGIGSKPILAMLPICFIDPGDVILSTVPGYPVCATYTKYLGGVVHNLPLREENGFFPDLSNIPAEVLQKAKMLYINYPNNPTGTVATREFFERVVAFARKNNILVVNDAAYASLTYDGYEPLSFLSVDGAKEVGLEVHSLSKSFNMTGWRIGFLVGDAHAVKAYGTVKDNTDSGQFRAIQKAGVYALDHPEITAKTAAKYSRRFDLLIAALRAIGFDVRKPKGSFFTYMKAPKGAKGRVFKNATEFSEFLIESCLISTVPWDDVGNYLRFSVTFEAANEEDERRVVAEMKARLQKLELQF